MLLFWLCNYISRQLFVVFVLTNVSAKLCEQTWMPEKKTLGSLAPPGGFRVPVMKKKSMGTCLLYFLSGKRKLMAGKFLFTSTSPERRERPANLTQNSGYFGAPTLVGILSRHELSGNRES